MTIICKTMVNPTSYRVLMKHAFNINPRMRKRRKRFYVLSILLIIGGIYQLSLLLRTTGFVDMSDIYFVVLLLSVGFYILWLAKFGMLLFAYRAGIKQHFRNFTVPEYAINYQFTDEGIHMEMMESSAFSLWTAVVGWQEGDNYFYFELQRGGYQFICKDGFEKGDLEKFRILIRDKLKVG